MRSDRAPRLKRNILLITALVLAIGWGIGFFIFAMGLLVHSLLFLAAIAVVIRFTLMRSRRKRELNKKAGAGRIRS
jgi:uncharacterized membrane protein